MNRTWSVKGDYRWLAYCMDPVLQQHMTDRELDKGGLKLTSSPMNRKGQGQFVLQHPKGRVNRKCMWKGRALREKWWLVCLFSNLDLKLH